MTSPGMDAELSPILADRDSSYLLPNNIHASEAAYVRGS
eukprot:SAG31_NODE_44468_length_262_cov_1.349693_1_plen_38_part_10